MNNSERFLESIIHAEHSVYGFKLKPFSLFHASYLEFLKNPLLVGGPVTAEKILEASIVCSSSSSAEIVRTLNGKLSALRLLLFREKTQAAKWEAYFLDYFSLPQCWPSNGDKKPSIPFFLTASANIIRETGWAFSTVFYELPLGTILWLNLSFGFLESGKTSLISDDEAAAMAFAASLQEGGIK